MEGVTLAQLGLFVATLSVAILSPGPGILAVSHAAFSMGRRGALPYALGLALGASLWCLIALLGLTVLFQTFPLALSAFHVVGGLYLLWIAFKMWSHAADPLPEPAGAGRGLAAGMALNLSNPKPGLFYASVLLSIFPDLRGIGATASVYAVALSVELFYYLGLASVLSAAAIQARYFAAKPWIDRIAAVLIAVLGLLLILRH
ncbi:Lysine exporter protein (LYSE/YGGA) [Rubellimicrobium mesophilum DSM 19309]|uniref:Lysine exporter protein (LYSE/YGGA) n=1 Tax=Rubellimicrobium mesophilum DSM 19309 TaxID=442562 RepID=A0A017HTS1_9RHOB|nr:LysE family transporter [Rubellimicrobium mesophilum]EYD77897.1 Lysine exporter protein (LYSE/YGGA) [Rubellimicrobium mesophilum DSM 19309]